MSANLKLVKKLIELNDNVVDIKPLPIITLPEAPKPAAINEFFDRKNYFN